MVGRRLDREAIRTHRNLGFKTIKFVFSTEGHAAFLHVARGPVGLLKCDVCRVASAREARESCSNVGHHHVLFNVGNELLVQVRRDLQ